MPLLRMRLTGSDDAVRAVTNLLQSLDGIEHVEEIARREAPQARTWVAAAEHAAGAADLVRIANAGLRESHVHDVTIVRESPNYPTRS